jgi:hypothetical protein
MMAVMERVTGPKEFIAIRDVSKLGSVRSERDKSVLTADISFMALRVDPEAGLRE